VTKRTLPLSCKFCPLPVVFETFSFFQKSKTKTCVFYKWMGIHPIPSDRLWIHQSRLRCLLDHSRRYPFSFKYNILVYSLFKRVPHFESHQDHPRWYGWYGIPGHSNDIIKPSDGQHVSSLAQVRK
jgi:hypothetical protein